MVRSSAILKGGAGKSAIWTVNAEEDYHEEIRRVDRIDRPRLGLGLTKCLPMCDDWRERRS